MDILSQTIEEIRSNKLAILKCVVSCELSKDQKDILKDSEFLSQSQKDNILAERQAIYQTYQDQKIILESFTDINDVFNFQTNIYDQ